MPLALDPVSSILGQSTFSAVPSGTESLSSFMPAELMQILSGMPHFDPSSIQHSPVGRLSTPQQAEQAGQVAPGALVAGLSQGMPFSAQVGLGTGVGAGAGVGPSPTGPANAGHQAVLNQMASPSNPSQGQWRFSPDNQSYQWVGFGPPDYSTYPGRSAFGTPGMGGGNWSGSDASVQEANNQANSGLTNT